TTPLEEYRAKRDFTRTAEPAPRQPPARAQPCGESRAWRGIPLVGLCASAEYQLGAGGALGLGRLAQKATASSSGASESSLPLAFLAGVLLAAASPPPLPFFAASRLALSAAMRSTVLGAGASGVATISLPLRLASIISSSAARYWSWYFFG